MKRNDRFPWFGALVTVVVLAMPACSGAANVPKLVATQTRTSPITSMPAPTLTLTPSPTPTEVSSPSTTPPSTGMKIEEQSNGTALVTDYDNRYQLLLPQNWFIVFSPRNEHQQTLEQHPEFVAMAESLRDSDPDLFRLAAMTADREFIEMGIPTLLTINAYTDPALSTTPLESVTAMIEDSMFGEDTPTTWNVIKNQNNIEVGIVEGPYTAQTPEGISLHVQRMVIVFQANEKLIMVEIMVPEQIAAQTLKPFDEMIDSINVGGE